MSGRLAIYEINTAVWLGGRSLADVPGGRWDALAALPVDAVWLMGVWQRSPAGRAIALEDPALPRADVIGSPYCVHDYVVDPAFGGRAALARARAELAARGLKLILDYVPNHVAPDHPWLADHLQFFVTGSETDLAERPDEFVRTAGGIVARGRDPYFPPWRDVVQLDAFSAGLREAAAETVLDLAAQCDGLRCDMAMLVTNEVFARTWRREPPREEFWPTLIERVKRAHPALLFLAEAYWDMEHALMRQGFDFCYDKRLYDRLVDRGDLRAHLRADPAFQARLVRFIENHDEPRAASVFGPAQARAAAVVMSTLPGARLYHDGQLSGRRAHIPVFVGRAPAEPPDAHLEAFYRRLLPVAAQLDGEWRLLETTGPVLAWTWTSGHTVVVNLGDGPAAGPALEGVDLLSGQPYDPVLTPWSAAITLAP